MPGFNFSLQKVLDLRRQKEEQAQMALASSQRRLKDKQKEQERLQKELINCEQEFRSKKTLSRGDIWLWRQYRQRLDAEIRECNGAVRRLESRVERQRRELVDRSKERELLERFKENRKKAFDYEQKKEEQKEFDETATTRYKNGTV
ncbi:MAG: flagellar export protein FliJ [Desulfonatronovibrionaceae bacterium]